MRKKKLIAFALMAAMSTMSLAGCGLGDDTSEKQDSAKDVAEKGDKSKGSVYYLNFKPEQDEAWKKLAKVYEEEKNIKVTVVTAASGKYEETLTAELGKKEAPTLFQVNGPVGLKNYRENCLDLEGTDVVSNLTSDSFKLVDNGQTLGVAYVVESYGIITNKTLLEEAGHSVDEIKDFDSLKAVVDDITARKDELGFSAFTSSVMDGSSDWRFKTHLANLPIYYEYKADGIGDTDKIKGTYLDNYRKIWDLYINNGTCDPKELSSKTGDDAENEFVNSQAVFFQNGSWEYGAISAKLKDEEVQMIPIYVGVEGEANQGLCTGTENYWCVNSQASEDDVAATLDFINWCVTSEAGTKAMAEDMGFVIPFKNAVESNNVFVKQDNEYTAAGKTPVSWNFPTMPSEEWKNGVGSALTAYAADQTDDNWNAVVKAFVEGWETEKAITQ